MEKTFIVNGIEVKVHDYKAQADEVSFVLGGQNFRYKLAVKDSQEMILENGERFKAAVSSPNRDGESVVMVLGQEIVLGEAGKKMKKSGGHAGGLTSPMPGKIFKVLKDVGSDVKKGESILILEAMKMEHAIRADKDGKVKKISFKVGELVQGGVTLAEVE
jgi:biotin carboxyl carrier protein